MNPANTAQATLVLADPHPIVLAGMVHLFQREPDFAVVACCTGDAQARDAVVEYQPRVLVVDLHLPASGGLALLRDVARRGAATHTVLLATALSDDDMVEALRHGVSGVILKDMEPQLLVACVRRVARGGRWIENAAFAGAMDRLIRHDARMHELKRRLTRRELEILALVADGLPNSEIHARLAIAEGTVKIHMHNIYEKLGVRGRVQLALYARGGDLPGSARAARGEPRKPSA